MINRALRLIREFHGLTQTELAEKLEMSKSYLSELESAESGKTPSLEILQKYSQIFSIPLSSILLFAERVEEGKFSEKVRIGAAKKVLQLLDWISEREKFRIESQ